MRFLAVLILLFLLLPASVKAGSFDLDVVLVICDEVQGARTAANLLVDLAAQFDSRVGFIMNGASRELTDLVSFRRDVKDGIMNAPAGPAGNLAANIDAALDMLEQRENVRRRGAVVVIAPAAVELPGKPSVYRVEGTRAQDAFAALVGAHPIPLETAGPIPIPNESMYHATLIIHSTQPVSDVSVEGAAFTVDSDRAGTYAVVSVPAPAPGYLPLSFTAPAGADVRIEFIPLYDISLVLAMPRTAVGQAEFEWRLQTRGGAAVTDARLIEQLSPVLRVQNAEHPFPAGHTAMDIALAPGTHEAYLYNTSQGFVRMSNVQPFYIPYREPIPPIQPAERTPRMLLVTLFRPQASLSLAEAFIFTEENLPLSLSLLPGEWESLAGLQHDGALLQAAALVPGTATLLIEAADAQGNTAAMQVDVVVVSGPLLIAAAAALIAVLMAALAVRIIRNKPEISLPMNPGIPSSSRIGELAVKMFMPPDQMSRMPPAIALVLPNRRGKITLHALIQENTLIANDYNRAFEAIGWFANGTVIRAKSKTLLEIRLPVREGYEILVDNEAKPTAVLDCNGTANLVIRRLQEGGEYKIELCGGKRS